LPLLFHAGLQYLVVIRSVLQQFCVFERVSWSNTIFPDTSALSKLTRLMLDCCPRSLREPNSRSRHRSLLPLTTSSQTIPSREGNEYWSKQANATGPAMLRLVFTVDVFPRARDSPSQSRGTIPSFAICGRSSGRKANALFEFDEGSEADRGVRRISMRVRS